MLPGNTQPLLPTPNSPHPAPNFPPIPPSTIPQPPFHPFSATTAPAQSTSSTPSPSTHQFPPACACALSIASQRTFSLRDIRLRVRHPSKLSKVSNVPSRNSKPSTPQLQVKQGK